MLCYASSVFAIDLKQSSQGRQEADGLSFVGNENFHEDLVVEFKDTQQFPCYRCIRSNDVHKIEIGEGIRPDVFNVLIYRSRTVLAGNRPEVEITMTAMQ